MIRKQTIVNAAYAVVFATAYVLIDWIALVPYGFPDLDNYRYGFQSGWYVFSVMNRSLADFLLAEGVWVYLFDLLYSYVGNIDTVFSVISFVSILLMSIYVIGRTGNPLYLIFFTNPAYLDFAIGQIRSGFAAGIFWLAVYIQNRWLKVALVILAASIHTAFFVFGAFYLAFALLRRTRIVDRLLSKPLLSILVMIALGLVVTAARNGILMALNDVRGYFRLEFTSGLSLALAWGSFAFTYAAWQNRGKVGFEASFYAFCASMAFFSAIIGVYGSRFSSVALPGLAVMCSQLPPRYRTFFLIQYALFTIVYFFYWFAAQGRVA
jgi:hypothetical protein